MNGYGPFLQPLIWFRLYWAIAAVLLAIVTNLLWVRGTESSWRVRMNLAAARFSRATLAARAVCVVLMLGVGGYIFYNTHVLNPYRTTFKIDEARAQYEKKYRQYWSLPQPRITDVTTQIDIYPEQRSVVGQRHHVAGEQDLVRHRSRCGDHLAGRTWRRCRARISRSSSSASPEARRTLIEDPVARLLPLQAADAAAAARPHSAGFRAAIRQSGLSRIRSPTPTSCTTEASSTTAICPTSATRPNIELTDDSTRHKHGLEKVRRLPKLDDVAARQYNSVSFDADWINFDATVSTSARPDRHRARISAEGVGGERPPLLPLQDGRARS